MALFDPFLYCLGRREQRIRKSIDTSYKIDGLYAISHVFVLQILTITREENLLNPVFACDVHNGKLGPTNSSSTFTKGLIDN